MTTTVAELLSQIDLMVQGYQTGNLWSTGEIIGYTNSTCKDFILQTQILKVIAPVGSVLNRRIYSNPDYTMQIDRIAFSNRPLYRTKRYLLDRELPRWRTLAGIPKQYHQDQLAIEKFEVDRAPTSTMVGSGYSASGPLRPPTGGSLDLHVNGLLQEPDVDYTLAGTVITMTLPLLPGNYLRAFYVSGSGVANFVSNEIPTGAIDGFNTTFTLATSPNTNTLALYIKGVLQEEGVDYTLAGTTITMVLPPLAGSYMRAFYITGSGVANFTRNEIPGGAIDGMNTVFTIANIPVAESFGVYVNGLLQEPNVDYVLTDDTITMAIPPPVGSHLRAYYTTGVGVSNLERNKIPVGAINGVNTVFTIMSSTFGTLRRMSGVQTYTATLPAGGGSGVLRYVLGTRAYNATLLRGRPNAATLRQMFSGLTNFQLIATRLPREITSVSDTLPVPNHCVVYIKFGVLSNMFGKEGEGQDIARSKYCASRYDRGIQLYQRLLSARHDQIAQYTRS